MGFYLRKSVSVGPFRFNLSGSGVGMSVGVRGLRVGTGPRGNYVHLGRGGVYYRHTIAPGAAPSRPVQPMIPIAASTTTWQEIDSGPAAEIVDASSEELLEELRAKKRKMRLRPFAIVAGVFLFLVAIGREWPPTAILVEAAMALVMIFAAGYRDRLAKTVVILYQLDPHAEQTFSRFAEWADALAGAGRTWHVGAIAQGFDRRYHAGASSLVRRNVTSVRNAEPPFVKTNVSVLSIVVGTQTLYFMPDRLLVYDPAGVGAVSYRTLAVEASRQRFIEDGGVPSDATVVDRTWRYVNKGGGPDRRFRDNPELPICLYDELTFHTTSGLNETIQVSRAGLGEGFAAAVRSLAGVTV